MHCRGWQSYLARQAQVTGALLPLRNRRVALLAIFSALRENPFWGKPTTQQQRFQYLWLALWAAGGAAELAYLAVPILFLWTGWMPVPAFDRVFFCLVSALCPAGAAQLAVGLSSLSVGGCVAVRTPDR
jgi:cellulose synthase (UDP-forming)